MKKTTNNKYSGVYLDKNNNTYYVNSKAKTLDNVYVAISKRGFDTQKEAYNFKINEKNRIENTYFNGVKNNKTKFECMVEQLLEKVNKQHTMGTYLAKKRIFDKYIIPRFKNSTIDKITLREVSDFWSDVENTDNGAKYKNTIISTFIELLDYLVLYNCLNNERCNNFKQILVKFKNDRVVGSGCKGIITPGQFQEFISTFSDDELKYKLAFKMLYQIGARDGELRAIQVRCLDLINNTVLLDGHINNRYSTGSWQRFDGLKTRSHRIESFSNDLKLELLEYIKLNNLSDNDYLFYGFDGKDTPISANAFRRKADRHLEMANLPHIRIHDFRHSNIVALLENGCDIKAVSERVGHSSVNITQDIYNHVTEKQNQKINSVLDNLFS